jgi:hypothetical protein
MPPQVERLLLLFLFVISVFAIARNFLVPASFGLDGPYRADALGEIMRKPLKYAGKDACAVCHPEHPTKTAHVAKGVACETCHGPSLAHAENPSTERPVRPAGRDFCAKCHAKKIGRRASFPQIDPYTHNAGTDCAVCHPIHAEETGQ